MSIQIASNFNYRGALPNFERDMFQTVADMIAIDDTSLPQVFIATCVEHPDKIFIYCKSNESVDPYGKWRDVTAGASKITVDAILSDTSENPVQNKVVTKAIKGSLKTYTPSFGTYEELSSFDFSSLDDGTKYIMDVVEDETKDKANTLYLADKEGNCTYFGIISVFANKTTVLDKFSIDADGKLKFDGNLVIEIDDALSDTSVNPVQNKVVKEALDTKVDKSQLGAKTTTDAEGNKIYGVATLDEDGKINSSLLPSYIDDVVEGYLIVRQEVTPGEPIENPEGEPIPGEDIVTDIYEFFSDAEGTAKIDPVSSKIYIDLNTEKTYRWTGSTYAVISETIALGETSSTAFRGDYGKEAYDHAKSVHAPADAEKNVIVGITINGEKVDADENRIVDINAGEALFTTSSPINNPIGGFKNGDVVVAEDKMSIIDALNKILHKYVAPYISVTLDPSTTIYESAVDTVSNLKLTIKVTKGSMDITSIVLKNGEEILETFADVTNGGTFEHVVSSDITDTTTFTVVATDGSTGSSKDVKIIFTNKTYYGFVTNGTTLTADVITSLQNNILKTSAGLNYTGVTYIDSHVVYAYPASFGTISSIKDQNNFEYISDFTLEVIEVNGVSYNCYKKTISDTSTDFTFIFA